MPTLGSVAESDVEDLVVSARSGDESAWRELVQRYVDLVWSIARAHGLGSCDAADVSQTTWLRLAENLDKLDDPARVGAWLSTTARRESLRVLRHQRRLVPSADLVDGRPHRHHPVASAEPPADPGEWLVSAASGMGSADEIAVAEAFAELPDHCQRLLRTLIADPPPSYADVSAALGIPVGSIGPTRARCLDRMRASIFAITGARAGTDGSSEREVS